MDARSYMVVQCVFLGCKLVLSPFDQFGYGFTCANTRCLAVVCYQNFGSITAL